MPKKVLLGIFSFLLIVFSFPVFAANEVAVTNTPWYCLADYNGCAISLIIWWDIVYSIYTEAPTGIGPEGTWGTYWLFVNIHDECVPLQESICLAYSEDSPTYRYLYFHAMYPLLYRDLAHLDLIAEWLHKAQIDREKNREIAMILKRYGKASRLIREKWINGDTRFIDAKTHALYTRLTSLVSARLIWPFYAEASDVVDAIALNFSEHEEE